MFIPGEMVENMKRSGIIRGFSLIELLIVIAILGIASSMAAYGWQIFAANSNLRTAARDLAADIALYRQRAVGENNTYTMAFDIANNNYTITNAKNADTVVKSLSGSDFGVGIALSAVTFGGDTITVASRGLIGAGSITIVNSRGSSAVITVSIAGRANLQFNI
jgi:prepilin-type N-terminal cleavage/methylation domain-containing protein